MKRHQLFIIQDGWNIKVDIKKCHQYAQEKFELPEQIEYYESLKKQIIAYNDELKLLIKKKRVRWCWSEIRLNGYLSWCDTQISLCQAIEPFAKRGEPEPEINKEKKSKTLKPPHRPITKITKQGLLEFAELAKRLNEGEGELTKSTIRERIAKKYNCDLTTYPNWLKSRLEVIGKSSIWDLDENEMRYFWDDYYIYY